MTRLIVCSFSRVVVKLGTYVGFDVHKGTIAAAVAEESKRGEVGEHGKIANTVAALTKLVSRLHHNGSALKCCYEAGPCGCGLQRQLGVSGHECVVVAPSLLPLNVAAT